MPRIDVSSRAVLFDSGLSGRFGPLQALPPEAHVSTTPAALLFGNLSYWGLWPVHSGGYVQESELESSNVQMLVADPDYDLASKSRCSAAAHTRRELFWVDACVVSGLVQWLRATEADEISRPVCLPQLRQAVLRDLMLTSLTRETVGAKKHTETEPSSASTQPEPDYPVASFYKPAEYEWTTEGFEAREALKRFSEETHADR